MKPASDRASRKRDRGAGESHCIGRVDFGAGPIQRFRLIGEDVTLSDENRYEVPSSEVVHHRKQFEADAIAQQRSVGVGRILERHPAQPSADLDGVGAADSQQGMSCSPRGTADCSHADQTVEPCATQQIDENGLCTIVSGVPRANIVWESGIASCSGPSFDVGPLFDMNGPGFELRSDGTSRPFDGAGFEVRSLPEAVIDMNCNDVESSGSSESEQCQGVCSAGDGTCDSGSLSGKCATPEEIGEVGSCQPIEKRSRIGNGSALVVAATLAATRVAVRGDLLEIAATEGGNREDADNSQNDADPPVPHICRDHEEHRSGLGLFPASGIGDVDVEAFEDLPAQLIG